MTKLEFLRGPFSLFFSASVSRNKLLRYASFDYLDHNVLR